ncbi:alpha-L-fucosidase 1 [Amaranthus tricolor]|uniref:alpha-L-fucosidase 1 n=1 Tax=Amaranthus tricolor TaxID=29722 RepID=UPI002586F97F|nr:alpha-L-fucosidase 1 [Amaranthus tricolor]
MAEPFKNSNFPYQNPLKQPHQKPISPLIFLLLLSYFLPSFSLLPVPPPLPLLPIPTSNQLSWQLSEMSLFLHFGPNTFTDSEWGDGKADPSVFFPSNLDPKQWVNVAKSTGFKRVILTAKHHDGFCLWPSLFTDYSVKSSNWRNGYGDVVGELAEAAKEVGIQLGLYLSPWDRHEKCYGNTLKYNEFYLAQMTELLTRYGEINEVWLDGAKGEGEKDMEYFFDIWFDLIHQLQSKAVIFSDAGPDVRWVGDEAGVAGSTCWSSFNRSAAKIGGTDAQYSRGGDQHGHDWVPAECDVSVRPGWFWHASESPKSAITLLDIYYKSVGRNCLLLLNVPPNSSGLISDEDIKVLQEFSELRNSIFSNNLAKHAIVTASSTRGGRNSPFDASQVTEESIYTYWAPEKDQACWVLYIHLTQKMAFNVVLLREPIQLGQRVIVFHLDIMKDTLEWQNICNGTTIGYKRLLQFPRVESQYMRLVIEKARGDPLISFVGVHMDPYITLTSLPHTTEKTPSKGAKYLSKLKTIFG